MKKLGKKERMQNGTMMAFSCDCIATCNTVPCNCSDFSTNANTRAANMGKVVATALSGGVWFG